MSFEAETSLAELVKYLKASTKGEGGMPEGIPIYIDPIGLSEADKTMASTVRNLDVQGVPLRTTLKLLLNQLDLTYVVGDGLLRIISLESADRDEQRDERTETAEFGGGMGFGMGFSLEQMLAAGAAAEPGGDQGPGQRAEDRQRAEADMATADADKAGPSVAFPIAGRFDIPSRRDPQLLEVTRVEMPAEYYAKAVPVMTPRVYRLAKLTNKGDFALLPGKATVYVGSDFVGPDAVAAGGRGRAVCRRIRRQHTASGGAERLVRKARSVQGRVARASLRACPGVSREDHGARSFALGTQVQLPGPSGPADVPNPLIRRLGSEKI